MGVDGQHQFVSADGNQFLGQVHFVGLDQAAAHLAALGQREGISHRTADEHLVANPQ